MKKHLCSKWMTLQVVFPILGLVACGQSTGGSNGGGESNGTGGVAQSSGGTPSGTGGVARSLVPYAGGLSNLVTPITFLGAVNTMKKWAELSGCTGSAADIGNNCQGYAASQCQGGVEVILCTKQGGGHEAGNASLGWPVLKRHTLP